MFTPIWYSRKIFGLFLLSLLISACRQRLAEWWQRVQQAICWSPKLMCWMIVALAVSFVGWRVQAGQFLPSGSIPVVASAGYTAQATSAFNAIRQKLATPARYFMAASMVPSTLGSYPNANVALGGAAIITPSVAPTSVARINAAAGTNFKGTFTVDPVTGVVHVTNVHPVGTFLVTITAFDSFKSPIATQTFTLTVQPGPACSTKTVFTNAVDVAVGAAPRSVAIGDFNGDGKQDLAITNQTSNTVSIRLGDGMGGFSGTTEVGVGMNPYTVVIVDHNGDGKQDFVTSNFDSGDLSIGFGDGTGGFNSSIEPNILSTPTSVAVIDINADGLPALAVTSPTFGVKVKHQRLGIFNLNFPGGSGRYFAAAGDFNSNGFQDLAIANRDSNTVSIWLLVPVGPAIIKPEVSVGTAPQCVVTGDFNGDGKQDFATANKDANTVSIRLGDGQGNFTGTTEVSVGMSPRYVAIGDFNGDGKQDFVAVNYSSGTASIRFGDGLGGFSGTAEINVGTNPQSVAIGDFNGDGRQDFAVANEGSNNVSIRLGGCDLPPTITPTNSPLTAGQSASAMQIATASDALDDENTLNVTATLATGSGITLSGLAVDSTGKVTADVAADCTATTSTFTLQVTDSGGLSNTATLTVTVSANTPPTLSYPSNPGAVFGQGLTVIPLAPPTDNGSIASFQVFSIVPALASGITVNSAGVVSVANTVPANTYAVTIRATDNCGLTKDASFSLGVAKLTSVITWTPPAFLLAGPLAASVLNATANTTGTFSYTPAAGTVLGPGSVLLTANFTPDSGNYNPASQSVSLPVLDNSCGLTVNPTTLPAATRGTPFVQTLSASPTGSYVFSVLSGQLPPGISLVNTLGIYSLRGTPTTAGTYKFTVKARKNNSTCESARTYTLNVP